MQTLILNDVDDAIVERLNRQAEQHGRSAEAEHREILQTVLDREEPSVLGQKRSLTGGRPAASEELRRKLREFRESQGDRPQTPSEVLVREGRDER